ncbi:MAG: hypothetical protein CMP58_03640 [Flavobacteriales bacterium]|nr:hypothetical protein [Flavobacteriales bacterium]
MPDKMTTSGGSSAIWTVRMPLSSAGAAGGQPSLCSMGARQALANKMQCEHDGCGGLRVCHLDVVTAEEYGAGGLRFAGDEEFMHAAHQDERVARGVAQAQHVLAVQISGHS